MRASNRKLLLLAVVAALAVAACSNEEPKKEPKEAAPTPEPPSVCPLTGQDIPADITLPRPAVVVKVENSPQSRPQTGLRQADLVFEEIVEGGMTRFAAIFHCDGGKKIGPVRSARFDDPNIVKPYTRVMAYAGANSIVEGELRKKKMILFTEQNDVADAFYRVPPGSLDVHSLYLNVEKIRKKVSPAKAGVNPTEGIFTFGDVPADAKKARVVTMNFSTSNIVQYRWQKGSWRRYQDGAPFVVKPGGQLAVPNVLVQEVHVDHSKRIVDVAGNKSPDIFMKGTGRALLFRDGKVIVGKWTTGNDGIPHYTTAAGDPFTFALGPIWVELVPSAKGQVKGRVAFK